MKYDILTLFFFSIFKHISRILNIDCIYRGRKFYGKMLYEAIQTPGETMYMPHLTGHAVYNLDETVAATGNPYYGTAIDESAFELFDKKLNWFARDNGSDIIIFDG